MEKRDILSMSPDELSAALKELNEPAFRAKQIYSWLHSFCVTSFDEMTNISKALRQKLDDNFVIIGVSIEKSWFRSMMILRNIFLSFTTVNS